MHYEGHRFDFEDRLLAHLQVVVSLKLRRNEPFFLSWVQSAATGGGRRSIWIDSGVPLYIEYTGGRPPSINREWVETLTQSANSSAGLVITEEGTIHPAP